MQSGPILVDNAYVLREKLGQGGMAAVYRASRLIDGHDVALKLLGEAGLVETPEHSSPELHVRPHLARSISRR